jgi:hypothetical protein
MFIHSVYFWLRDGADATERDALIDGLKALQDIKQVRHIWIGRPADTDRPVVERSYDVALVTVFDDKAGHDTYQDDPLHVDFVERHKGLWKRIQVFDVE